jgi:hypothetical protein
MVVRQVDPILKLFTEAFGGPFGPIFKRIRYRHHHHSRIRIQAVTDGPIAAAPATNQDRTNAFRTGCMGASGNAERTGQTGSGCHQPTGLQKITTRNIFSVSHGENLQAKGRKNNLPTLSAQTVSQDGRSFPRTGIGG